MFAQLHFSAPLVACVGTGFGLLVVLAFVGKVPLGYNLRNLLIRWPVTLLTALAFTLVVSLLTVMLAFVAGMTRLNEASGQPGNVIILSDGATDEMFSNLSYGDVTNIDRQPGILAENGQPLCSKEVFIVVTQPILAPDGTETNRRRFVQVRGIDDSAITSKVHSMGLFPDGKWFSEAGVQDISGPDTKEPNRQAIQVVLGEGVARMLGADKNPDTDLGFFMNGLRNVARFFGFLQRDVSLKVGDVFDLGPRQWIVTGIMKSAGSTFDSEIWAKRSIVGPMFGKDRFTALVARTKDAPSAASVGEYLRKNYKQTPVRAEPETEYYEKLSETNKQFSIAIYFVTIIMAVGGVLGVMNTMFAAISQRSKDIGMLRILGFARWQILVSFFLETLTIALIGGLLGCALGYLSDGLSATSVVSGGQGGGKTVALRLVVDANTLAVGMLFTLVMGAVGGVLPSLSAMRLRPLESLR
jgi:ABC-type antimicrobial peptide transport system permease subunit